MAGVQKGTRFALGIILVWFGGACLFVAFMSGKTTALKTAEGKAPKDARELTGTVATAIQKYGATPGSAGPGANLGGVVGQ